MSRIFTALMLNSCDLGQTLIAIITKPPYIDPDANTTNFCYNSYRCGANRKFARLPASADDAHVPLLDADLTDIFCFEYERVVSHDYTVRFETRLFQILKGNRNRPQPKKQVTVRKNWMEQ